MMGVLSGKMVMPSGFNIMEIDNGHFGTMAMHSGLKKNEQQYARWCCLRAFDGRWTS
jgi:hypothetical protein